MCKQDEFVKRHISEVFLGAPEIQEKLLTSNIIIVKDLLEIGLWDLSKLSNKEIEHVEMTLNKYELSVFDNPYRDAMLRNEHRHDNSIND